MGVGLQKTNRERERDMSPAKIGKHKNARADPRRE
jgi:hypothetical protein